MLTVVAETLAKRAKYDDTLNTMIAKEIKNVIILCFFEELLHDIVRPDLPTGISRCI